MDAKVRAPFCWKGGFGQPDFSVVFVLILILGKTISESRNRFYGQSNGCISLGLFLIF